MVVGDNFACNLSGEISLTCADAMERGRSKIDQAVNVHSNSSKSLLALALLHLLHGLGGGEALIDACKLHGHGEGIVFLEQGRT